MRNESIITSFLLAISPMVSYLFREKWEAGVWNQGIFRISCKFWIYNFGSEFIYIYFHDIIFPFSLTATRALTFGYIKWTPDIAFTDSFLDIVFGQYLRKEMGKKLPP